MDVTNIIELVVIGVMILALVVYSIVKIVKTKCIGKIWEATKKACYEAEQQFGAGEGCKKKAYVLTKISELCEELGIPFEFIRSLLNTLIDKLIEGHNALSKDKNEIDHK